MSHIFQKLALIIEEKKKKVSIIAEEMVKKGKGVEEKVIKTKEKGVTNIELKQKDADKVPIVKEKKKEEETPPFSWKGGHWARAGRHLLQHNCF